MMIGCRKHQNGQQEVIKAGRAITEMNRKNVGSQAEVNLWAGMACKVTLFNVFNVTSSVSVTVSS